MSEVPEVNALDERFLNVLVENGFIRTTPFQSLDSHGDEKEVSVPNPEAVVSQCAQELLTIKRSTTERKRQLSVIDERLE